MKFILSLVFCALPHLAYAHPKTIILNHQLTNARSMSFKTHTDPFTLAIDLPNGPVIALRETLKVELGLELKFFTGWNAAGEAHITVISPPEFIDVLSKHLSEDEINSIARNFKIQSGGVQILGLGSGKLPVGKETHETYFVIVDSLTARRIRLAVHAAYVRKGGNPKDWDPSWYFPHVTVGFTHADIHEHQGLLKSVKHAWDPRFDLKL